MKAVLFRSPEEPLVAIERETPKLTDGDALLKVDLCGVCASDLMAIDGVVTDYSPPVVLGHEVAGVVVESRNAKAPIGTRASVNPMITCGECVYCRRGQHKYCSKLYGIGHDIDGAFADVMLLPKALIDGGGLLAVSDDVPASRLMFLEPLSCVLNAMDETPFHETLAVLGAGPIGLLFVQLGVEKGLSVVVVEPKEHRREVAQMLGAALAVAPDRDGFDALRDATEGGADTVIVATDHSSAIEGAFQSARRGAAINFFGLAPKGRSLSLELEQLHFQGYTILASWAFSRVSLEASRRRLDENTIDLSPLVAQRFSLDEPSAAIDYARSGHGVKAAFDPTK